MTLSPEQIEHGFWWFRPEFGFPPSSVKYPEEYTGAANLNLVCTQLSISDYQQRKLVKEWVKVLPGLNQVRYLWFNSRTNQAMFEAACQMPNLEGLYVKWGSVSDLAPLSQARNLKYLKVCAPSVTEISILVNLKKLIVLELVNLKRIGNLHPLSTLSQLEGLSVSGNTWTTHVVESLTPLSQLISLKYLHLFNLKSLDGTLKPLCNLKSLVTLNTTYTWPISDFALLRQILPKLKYGSPLQLDLIQRFGKSDRKSGE